MLYKSEGLHEKEAITAFRLWTALHSICSYWDSVILINDICLSYLNFILSETDKYVDYVIFLFLHSLDNLVVS